MFFGPRSQAPTDRVMVRAMVLRVPSLWLVAAWIATAATPASNPASLEKKSALSGPLTPFDAPCRRMPRTLAARIQ
jgi:hypothetical protein